MLVVPGPALMRQSLSSSEGSAEAAAETNSIMSARFGIVYL
jgi:hypothetical protein